MVISTMRTRLLTTVTVGLALFLMFQGAVSAETEKSVLNVFIGTISDLTVYPDGDMNWTDAPYKPAAVDFETGTLFPDHPQGWTTHVRVKTFLITTNSQWIVSVQGTSPYFTCDSGQFPGAWQEKPVTDIVWGYVGSHAIVGGSSPGSVLGHGKSAPFGEIEPDTPTQWMHHLTMNPEIVTSGNPGQNIRGAIFFRILLDWKNDSPGNYSYQSVIFTLGAQ